MWFGIRISSPFHLATQIMSIWNPNCPKTSRASLTVRFLRYEVEKGLRAVYLKQKKRTRRHDFWWSSMNVESFSINVEFSSMNV